MNIFLILKGGGVVRGMGICTTSSLVVDNQILCMIHVMHLLLGG
jgi:hypothetical protein